MKAKTYLLLLASLAVLTGCTRQAGERDRSAIVDLPQGAAFFLNDAQGTPIALADARGAVVEQRAHHALGANRNDEPASDTHDFVGNELDTAIGISDFNARPYRADTGTFLAPDPVAVFNPEKTVGDPRRAHAYAYSAGDPINLQDSNGEFFDIVVDVASIGYDVYSIVTDNIIGNEDNLGTNLASLGADVVGAIVPFATGGGAAVRAATHGDEIVKVVTHADEVLQGAGAVKHATASGAAALTETGAREIGMIRDAARGRGNFGLGSATSDRAVAMGEAWVGSGARVASDGKTLLSADGLRQFRPPSWKPKLNRTQANFEQRSIPEGPWASNGHLDIELGPIQQ